MSGLLIALCKGELGSLGDGDVARLLHGDVREKQAFQAVGERVKFGVLRRS